MVDLKKNHYIFNELLREDIIRNRLQMTQNSLENPMGEGEMKSFY